jgi:hypothetical protein
MPHSSTKNSSTSRSRPKTRSRSRSRSCSAKSRSYKMNGGGGADSNSSNGSLATTAVAVTAGALTMPRISILTLILIVLAIICVIWVLFFNDRGQNFSTQTDGIFTRIWDNLFGRVTSTDNDSRMKVIVVTNPTGGSLPPPENTRGSIGGDPLTQIYTPPERNNPYITNADTARIAVPINQYTRRPVSEYDQVGIITRQNTQDGKSEILPIFGRRSPVGGDKWNYYTMTNSNVPVKIPLSFSGRDCTDDVGCAEVSSGDSMYIPALEGNYTVTIYRMNSPRYIA